MTRKVWVALLVGCALLAVGAGVRRWIVGPVFSAARVTRSELVQTVAATGRVRPPGRLQLAAKIPGVILDARCREGRSVTAGELLFALEADEARAQLDEADAQLRGVEARYDELVGASRRADEEALRRAEIALADATDRLTRVERLLEQSAIDVAQVEDVRRKREQASSQLETARATVSATGASGPRARLLRSQLDEARARRALAARRLASTQVTAPAAAVISDCSAVLGEVVTAGHALAVLVFDGPSELVIEPDEKNLALLQPGQRARASVDAYPDRVFDAKVSDIVRAVDPLRGTIEVRLVAEPPPEFLVPEMTVSVEIVVASKAAALTVPREALRSGEANKSFVFVFDGRAAVRREVDVGIRGDDRVEITSGLAEGEVVILPGKKPLASGARVRAEVS